MKRNQKKYTKKIRKGGAVDKLGWDASISGINKKIRDVEARFDVISTKLGNVGSVNGTSRENDTRFGEAGYLEPPIGEDNPMTRKSVSNKSTSGPSTSGPSTSGPSTSGPSTSEKDYNGSTPIIQNQYDEVDRLNEEIKKLRKNPNKFNREKLKPLIGLKNALFAKYQKRVDYLEKEQKVRNLSQEEQGEYDNLVANLNDPKLGGRRKSRRYRKSRKGKRTRKYKK
jgi:archaellum component FlaC